MANIDYISSGFKNQYSIINGSVSRRMTALQCIKYAISSGTETYSRAFGRSATALWLTIHKAIAVRCALDFSSPLVTLTPNYPDLEASEKSNMAYWIGMTFTAAAASAVLGIPRTGHASLAGARVRRINPRCKSLADLIGRDVFGDWHVLEAKGRQTFPSPTVQRYYKDQAGTIGSIDGQPVATYSYCIGLMTFPCQIILTDPEPDFSDTPPIDLSITHRQFISDYYTPVAEFLESDAERRVILDRSFRLRRAAFDPVERRIISVGLDEGYVDAFRKRGIAEVIESEFVVPVIDDERVYCGSDGIVVVYEDT
jgi:hypothetical protein